MNKIILNIVMIIILLLLTPPCYANKTVISIPSYCHQIVKIDGNKVYLKRVESKCMIAGEGRTEIDIDDSINSVEIYDNGKFWREQNVKSFDINAVIKASKHIGDINKSIETSNKFTDEGKQAAEKVFKQYNSQAFQDKLKQEQARLAKEVFKNSDENISADISGQQAGIEKADKSGQVYLFISKSVPIDTLRNYVKSISNMNTNITMILRGFVGGVKKIKPTMDFITNIIKKDAECDFTSSKCLIYDVDIRIDPELFKKYGITEVPAVVDSNGNKVCGDMGLKYLLEKIENKESVQNE